MRPFSCSCSLFVLRVLPHKVSDRLNVLLIDMAALANHPNPWLAAPCDGSSVLPTVPAQRCTGRLAWLCECWCCCLLCLRLNRCCTHRHTYTHTHRQTDTHTHTRTHTHTFVKPGSLPFDRNRATFLRSSSVAEAGTMRYWGYVAHRA